MCGIPIIKFTNGSAPTNWTFDNDAGRLGIIRNVSFKSSTPSVNGTFANSSGGAGSVSWTLNEQDGNKVIVYNSNFAKFANAKVPTGKVNITGIFKRFNKPSHKLKCFSRTPYSLDCLLGRSRESMRLNLQLPAQLPIAQNLYSLSALYHTQILQKRWRDFFQGIRLRYTLQIL